MRTVIRTCARQADQGCLSAVSGFSILLCGPCLNDIVHRTGVRYPPQLLDDVVAVLASAQAAIPQLTAGGPSADQAASLGGGQLGSSALHASAMGAAMAVRMEPVTPVDAKSVAKAFRYGSCFALKPLKCHDRHETVCLLPMNTCILAFCKCPRQACHSATVPLFAVP